MLTDCQLPVEGEGRSRKCGQGFERMLPISGKNLEPDLVAGCLKLWVFGRCFPKARDFWDGNWLEVRAVCASQGATVDVSGAILRNTDLRAFRDQCNQLYRSLQGTAILESLEPNLFVSLRANRQGHFGLEVRITPDHMTQQHEFREELDQSFLPAIIQSVERVLQRVPVLADRASDV